MVSKANIVGLYRRDVVKYVLKGHTSKNKFRGILYGVMSLSIVVVLLVGLLYSDGGMILNDMMSIYSPITSLYLDKNNLSFTSGSVVYSEELDYTIPMVSRKVDIVQGNVMIECTDSVIVSSIESGVVEDINYTIDGVKYIKIRHGVDTYSIIENVDVVSVSISDIVTKNMPIGVVNIGDSIVLKIYIDDVLIEDVKIVGSSIVVG